MNPLLTAGLLTFPARGTWIEIILLLKQFQFGTDVPRKGERG